jgi:hypothetical protein
MPRLTCAVVSTLATLLVCLAAPAMGAESAWGQVAVPGGVAAARRVLELGESNGRFDASLVADFTYRHSRTGDWSRAADKLRRYLANVETIQRIVGDAASNSIAPPLANASKEDAGRFRELCDALGIARRKVDGRSRYAPGTSETERERAEWAGALGLDVESISGAWTAGEAQTVSLASGVVPLPLPGFWRAGSKSALTLADLVRDRATGLFYTGLTALDDQTLTWFDIHPDLMRRVRDQSAGAFSAFARSIRIDGAAVVVAGGPRMDATWTRLTGRAASEPDSFIPALLTTDDGLLAYFFDAVRHASTSLEQAIAVRATERPSAIDEMYRAFRDGAGAWSVDARPFDRPAHDPAWTLSLVDLPSGRLGAPAWLPVVLERAVTDSNWPEKSGALPSRMPVGDVDWAIRWLFERPGDQVERVKLLRFAQRLDRLEDASPEAAEAALRTFRDLPALALALERMGVRDADTIARTGRAAYTLSRAADRKTVEPILARWQASFALLEQAARLRHLPARVTAPLVLSLADAATHPPREVTDRILHWITGTLLPVLAPGADAPRLDRESIARLVSVDARARGKVVWEGLSYDRNPLRVARRDLDALAAPAAVSSPGESSVLERLHSRLDQGFRSPGDARTMAADFDTIRMALQRPVSAGPQSDDRFSRQLLAAARALRTDPPMAKAGASPAPDLEVSSVFGAAADAVVQPIVYALAMSPLHQTPALQRDAWTFHDLAEPETREDWWREAWRPATQQPRAGGGSGLVGSWLLLDLQLGESIVPRRFDRADSLATPVLDAIFRDVALRAQLPDAEVAALADAVGRLAHGRAIVAEWQRGIGTGAMSVRSDPRGFAIGATRRGFLAWSLAQGGDAATNLTLSEIAGLGGTSRLAAMPLDGCACLAEAPRWAFEEIRPYWMAGVPAAFATDLQLRIGELLIAAHLPLQLVADIMPLAAADWLSHVDQYSNDDWEALTLWPRQVTRAELEGYVMQLIAEGVLAPLDEAAP